MKKRKGGEVKKLELQTLEEQVKKILSTFPDKRIRTDLDLLEDDNGALYVKTANQLLKVEFDVEKGVNITPVEQLYKRLSNIDRIGRNQGD